MKKLNNRGFGFIGVLAVIIILAAAGGIGAYVYHKHHKTNSTMTSSSNSSNSSTSKSGDTTNQTPDPYAGWKTYTNSNYGIIYKYPVTWMPSDEAINTPNQIQQSATKQEFSAGLKLTVDTKYNNTVAVEVL